MIDKEYWYSKKEKKFLHNVDTFYYSVKLYNDFTRNSVDPDVARFRRVMESYQKMDTQSTVFREVPFRGHEVYYHHGTFGWYYSFILQVQDYVKDQTKDQFEIKNQFDILIAPVVPPAASGIGSVTSEIIVQIRSEMLWQLGAALAFERSYEYVQQLCAYFKLSIAEVKENRMDFAWHTNALQDPETYFRVDHLSEMQVSRFSGVTYHYKFKNVRQPGKKTPAFLECAQDDTAYENSYEWDYLSLGKRGDKCFVRIYLKTKEVVENGYKGWFLKLWQLQGLISRYDLYVLEKAYERRRWNYCDIARLEFVLEYDDTLTEADRARIRAAIDTERPDYVMIRRLARRYTPALTKIINVEFQTMRKMLKTYELVPIRDNADKGAAKRIYDLLANRRLITDSLTHNTLRLVRPDGDDSNKYRADYTDFWKRLRGTKQVDVMPNKHQLKIVRNYSSKLNMEMRKTRAARAVSSFALTLTRNPETSIYEDAAELLAILNDNDMHRLFQYKHVRLRQETDDPLHDYGRQRRVTIIDDTGEFYENTGFD